MIRFPQMNIATSTVNRILNAVRDINTAQRAAMPMDAPSVPDAGPLGEAIDEEIAAPTGPMTETDAAMTADMTTGPLFP